MICSECHHGGHDDLMLLCDECDSSAHTFCVGLGHEVPEGSWFCRCCKPLDPEFPSSPQTYLSDERLANNAPTTTRVSLSAAINNSGEGLDLNSVSSQGLAGLSSPRQQFGGFQAAMPLAGAGASTVSGRIRLRHQIHHCLSERPDRPEGNFPNSQSDQARETTMQQERLCDNHSPAGQESDFGLPSFGMRPTWQETNPATSVVSDLPTTGSLWPSLEARNSLRDVDLLTAKEQFQVAVKSHLQNLSRGSDLGTEIL